MLKLLTKNKKEEISLVNQHKNWKNTIVPANKNFQTKNSLFADQALHEDNIMILDRNDVDLLIMTQDQLLNDIISEKYLIVFDLDNTLAALGKPIEPETLRCLQELSAAGHHLAIASGKSVYYMMGFCRQANLTKTWLIGENGAQTVFGVDLPPEHRLNAKVKVKSRQALADLKRKIVAKFGDKVWFQPNEVAITIFFTDSRTRVEMEKYIEKIRTELVQSEITVFPHSDSFDFSPTGIDKGKATTNLINWLEINPLRTIAVGDTWNDQPLFEACHHAIAINFPEALKSNGNIIHVSNIEQALIQIQKIL